MLSDSEALAGDHLAQGLNTPYGARRFLAGGSMSSPTRTFTRLNAPYGARCFLTHPSASSTGRSECLNAPYGARCFLTPRTLSRTQTLLSCLNAPYGARCFLTRRNHLRPKKGGLCVLMHLLALGAFRLGGIVLWARRRQS